jgi:hypothetical protein
MLQTPIVRSGRYSRPTLGKQVLCETQLRASSAFLIFWVRVVGDVGLTILCRHSRGNERWWPLVLLCHLPWLNRTQIPFPVTPNETIPVHSIFERSASKNQKTSLSKESNSQVRCPREDDESHEWVLYTWFKCDSLNHSDHPSTSLRNIRIHYLLMKPQSLGLYFWRRQDSSWSWEAHEMRFVFLQEDILYVARLLVNVITTIQVLVSKFAAFFWYQMKIWRSSCLKKLCAYVGLPWDWLGTARVFQFESVVIITRVKQN